MWFVISFGLVGSAILSIIALGYIHSSPPYIGPVSDHFDGKKFKNPSGRQAQGIAAVFKYLRNRNPGNWKKVLSAEVRIEKFSDQIDHINVTFINHSTFLIQTPQGNILTDPVWSERISPYQWIGPKRLRPPGVDFAALPKIDIILLSHNHYDHLDIPTLKNLVKKFDPDLIVPLGVKTLLVQQGIRKVRELDWWQNHNQQEIQITAIPANHFSSRGMFDRNTSLWCGFLFEQQGIKIYFVGDTGYSDLFKKIGEKIGPVDLAFIPIGAYQPQWFMAPIHISPNEAVQVHRDVKAKHSIAMHFGTFPLADEGSGTAEKDLLIALDDAGISRDKFIIPKEGYTYPYKTSKL